MHRSTTALQFQHVSVCEVVSRVRLPPVGVCIAHVCVSVCVPLCVQEQQNQSDIGQATYHAAIKIADFPPIISPLYHFIISSLLAPGTACSLIHYRSSLDSMCNHMSDVHRLYRLIRKDQSVCRELFIYL